MGASSLSRAAAASTAAAPIPALVVRLADGGALVVRVRAMVHAPRRRVRVRADRADALFFLARAVDAAGGGRGGLQR